MFIKKILTYIVLTLIVSGCSSNKDWNRELAIAPVGKPVYIQKIVPETLYGDVNNMNLLVLPKSIDTQIEKTTPKTAIPLNDAKNISVLLPLSGENAELGRGIRKSIEIAFFKTSNKNIAVNFYDMSGDAEQKENTVKNALASSPSIIIGPIFAEDAKLVRKLKPVDLPVLSFTSNTKAIGNGVMTVALIPYQSVEAIVKQAGLDERKSIMIFAPNSESGEYMAGAAKKAANIYNIDISGLLYYTPGDTDSMKRLANEAANHTARLEANTKAREILSNIMIHEDLDEEEKLYIETQLEDVSKLDTLGKPPFDSVLFLGSMNDSQTIVSFLRYFNVTEKDAKMYGTALWDLSNTRGNFSMSNAQYASLPAMDRAFSNTHQQISNRATSRLDTLGYDAANIAIGMLESDQLAASYLLSPSGYVGIDGLFKLLPNGTNERALQISKVNGKIITPASTDFIEPLYLIPESNISSADWISVMADDIDPMDYLLISDDYKKTYSDAPKTIQEALTPVADETAVQTATPIVIEEFTIETFDEEPAIKFENFVPLNLDTVNQKNVESVEIIL